MTERDGKGGKGQGSIEQKKMSAMLNRANYSNLKMADSRQ